MPVLLVGSWRPAWPPGWREWRDAFVDFFSETPRARPGEAVGQFFPTGEPLRAQENGRTVISDPSPADGLSYY